LNYYFDVYIVTRSWHQNFAYFAFRYEIRYESWEGGWNYFKKLCLSTQD